MSPDFVAAIIAWPGKCGIVLVFLGLVVGVVGGMASGHGWVGLAGEGCGWMLFGLAISGLGFLVGEGIGRLRGDLSFHEFFF